MYKGPFISKPFENKFSIRDSEGKQLALITSQKAANNIINHLNMEKK